MSTNERKGPEATGEALSRDSLQRLAKLRVDVALLARLVQTRRADAPQDDNTAMRLDEITNNLAWLEAQIGQVLDERAAPDEHLEMDGLDDADTDVPVEEAAAPGKDASTSDDLVESYVAGVTLDQIDEMSQLLESLKAHGDVVTAADHAEYATSTLSLIGYAICREADQLRDVLNAIDDDQRVEPSRIARPGVREEHATYLALPEPSPSARASCLMQPHPTYQ